MRHSIRAMKKDKTSQPSITEPRIPAADVPFFARALGARPIDTDHLARVTGGDSLKEKAAKGG